MFPTSPGRRGGTALFVGDCVDGPDPDGAGKDNDGVVVAWKNRFSLLELVTELAFVESVSPVTGVILKSAL
jgi:hypothetical protein